MYSLNGSYYDVIYMYTIYRTGCCKKGNNPLELVAVKGEITH